MARPLQIQQAMCKEANQLKRPVHNVFLSKRSFRKWERQGLVGSLRNRPTCRARLRSRTTASSGMYHIASSCMSYTHMYLATQSVQSGNETNDPLKSGPAKVGPAGPATLPLGKDSLTVFCAHFLCQEQEEINLPGLNCLNKPHSPQSSFPLCLPS